MQSAPGPLTVINGREYLYFAGTSYLGLQGHPAVVEAARAALSAYGIHTCTGRNGFGTCPPVAEVEQRTADFLQADEASYLVSGYASNFAVLATLSPHVELVFADEHAHDSLREAIGCLERLERPPFAFRHGDPNHLAEQLRQHVRPGQRPLVLTDGVFAVSGDLAPVTSYLNALEPFDGAMLHVDDAHGVAALGKEGRGALELAGVDPGRINRDLAEAVAGPRVFHSTTLSKAVGGHGGAVAGSAAFMTRLRSASGWYRGASAPATPVAAATAKALEIVTTMPELRRRLADNVTSVRNGLAAAGFDVESSPPPSVGFRLGSGQTMQGIQRALMAGGIVIAHARDYAGAGADGMLRIAVCALHTPEMIARLLETLQDAATAQRET